jgi:glycine hydroxymethyltransferase
MREKEFIFIAHKICDVLDNIKNRDTHAQIKEEVKALLNGFRVYNHATY